MNISIYVFGALSKGYTQCPEDYTKDIFQTFMAEAKSPTQIAIHRDGDLMYYGYVRQMEQGHAIGFCIVINAMMVTDPKALFSLFENAISYLITHGIVIRLGDNGDIISSVARLYLSTDDLKLVTDYLQEGFRAYEKSLRPLPAVSYGVSKDATACYSYDDNADEIAKSCTTNGYTFLYKSSDYEATRISSYRSIVARLHEENVKLSEACKQLSQTNGNAVMQKRSRPLVPILILLVSVCVVCIVLLLAALGVWRNRMNDAKEKIQAQQEQIDSNNRKYERLKKQYDKLSASKQRKRHPIVQTESDLADITNGMDDLRPFILKSASFDHATGYLRFTYYGLRDVTKEIRVRAWGSNGDSHNSTATLHVYKGHHSDEVFVAHSLSSRPLYYIELISGNVILGGGIY